MDYLSVLIWLLILLRLRLLLLRLWRLRWLLLSLGQFMMLAPHFGIAIQTACKTIDSEN